MKWKILPKEWKKFIKFCIGLFCIASVVVVAVDVVIVVANFNDEHRGTGKKRNQETEAELWTLIRILSALDESLPATDPSPEMSFANWTSSSSSPSSLSSSAEHWNSSPTPEPPLEGKLLSEALNLGYVAGQVFLLHRPIQVRSYSTCNATHISSFFSGSGSVTLDSSLWDILNMQSELGNPNTIESL